MEFICSSTYKSSPVNTVPNFSFLQSNKTVASSRLIKKKKTFQEHFGHCSLTWFGTHSAEHQILLVKK